MAEKCTKTSSPFSRWMKPYPLAALNHFTVPFSLIRCFLFRYLQINLPRRGATNTKGGCGQLTQPPLDLSRREDESQNAPIVYRRAGELRSPTSTKSVDVGAGDAARGRRGDPNSVAYGRFQLLLLQRVDEIVQAECGGGGVNEMVLEFVGAAGDDGLPRRAMKSKRRPRSCRGRPICLVRASRRTRPETTSRRGNP